MSINLLKGKKLNKRKLTLISIWRGLKTLGEFYADNLEFAFFTIGIVGSAILFQYVYLIFVASALTLVLIGGIIKFSIVEYHEQLKEWNISFKR